MPLPLEQKVDPRTAALIVVDMQNDYCHPEGRGAKLRGKVPAAVTMAPRLLRLIDEARAAGMPIIWVRTENNDSTVSEVFWDQRSNQPDALRIPCWSGTWGAEYYQVEPRPGEPVVTKHRYSAFVNTDLETVLHARGIRSLIMTGVATNACVESTARDGFMRDYYVVFVDDCTGAWTEEDQQATLRNITNLFGVVVKSDDVIEVWRRILQPAGAGEG